MPKLATQLSVKAVEAIKVPGLHFVGGVQGLGLHVTKSGARSWLLRAMVAGKRREMGLGNFPSVTLATARDKARAARELIDQGIDPIAHQQAVRSALQAAAAANLSFEQCSTSYVSAHEAGWKGSKHAVQWRNSLARYAYPVMGALQVKDIELPQVLQVLEPIWTTKTETASRVRNRIELVLDWATARGYRSGPNPARWRGHLDALLPAPSKVAKVIHHRAVAVGAVGAFMQRLRSSEGIGALALEFATLTAARSGEVRGAVWSEIDRDARMWVIPAVRMKAGREHRVPLSSAALAVLDKAETLPRIAESKFIFPAPRGGSLSDMTLTAVLRRLKVDAVPHGFRSTFRDWAAERTNYPADMVEMALAHAIESRVEAAYRRGDMVEKRRQLMSDWASFLSKTDASADRVIPIKKSRA